MTWLVPNADGVSLLLHCQPGAKVSRVVGEHDGRLKIALNAPAVENRANEVLVAWIAERLSVPRRQVQLVSGQTSRKKRVLVEGVSAELVKNALLFD
ncbi:DUF167 domain-containing protein [Zwartia sp.]|uniref:DUF167 domain-containing protein n=1 Tax=Zwartia sp. TaxID=2978004 RepID=UPI00271ED6DF|nr:DUF167 domain-containing protein [Zwartia sp.]MDO9024094.1 DUF167 domain-containing protein [Zwartia sp.]